MKGRTGGWPSVMPRAFSLLRTNAREAVRSLRRARLRTGLALVGVAIGIASVITLISLGEIAKARSRAELEALGTDVLTISTSGRGGRGIALSDAVRLADAVPAILAAAPRITAAGPVIHAGKNVSYGALQGVTNSFAGVNRLAVESGRFISDFDEHRYFCVVGAEVARAMRRAGAQQVLGESIVAAGRPFTVVGVLRDATERYALSFHLDADRSVFIPITTAQRLDNRPEITLIIARTRPGVHYTTATRDVQAWFRARAPRLELEITSARELIEQLESQMRLMTLLLAAIGGISLIVGGIGVMNTMLVSVAERRREIGLRRALGARRRDIRNQFLVESVILSVIGGIAGIVAGAAGTWAICQLTGWDFALSATAAACGIAVSSLAGLFFGLQPARHAARVDPIVALQAE